MFELLEKVFDNLLTVGGVSGLIALCITGCLCARYVQHGPEDPPEVLKFALTAIIGFYFGTAAVPKSAGATNQPPAITAPAQPH
jgi:hypothetical protein